MCEYNKSPRYGLSCTQMCLSFKNDFPETEIENIPNQKKKMERRGYLVEQKTRTHQQKENCLKKKNAQCQYNQEECHIYDSIQVKVRYKNIIVVNEIMKALCEKR